MAFNIIEEYPLDLKVLTQEGFIKDNMTDQEKYKIIKLNQQWLLVEDGMGMKKREYITYGNPDKFEYGLLAKSVYFIHCGIIGQGYVMAISRWYDRMYRVQSDKFTVPSSIHHSNLFIKLEDLFNHINENYKIEEK